MLLLLPIFIGCEEIIDVDLPIPAESIVIDAQFLTSSNAFMEAGLVFVDIKYANPFFEEATRYVTDAQVSIANLKNGEVLNLESADDIGFYRAPEIPVPIDKTADYELTVTHNDQTYKSTAKWLPAAKIDTVINLGEVKLDEYERIELRVYFKDLPNEKNYYLFDFGPYQQIQLFDDRFFPDQQFNFSIFPRKIQIIEYEGRIPISCTGISKSNFEYLAKLLELSEPDISGPFATPRPRATGNIINITDPKNPPFGYFKICEFDDFNYTVQ